MTSGDDLNAEPPRLGRRMVALFAPHRGALAAIVLVTLDHTLVVGPAAAPRPCASAERAAQRAAVQP